MKAVEAPREVEPDRTEAELRQVEPDAGTDVAVVVPVVIICDNISELVVEGLGTSDSLDAVVGKEGKIEFPVRGQRVAQLGLEKPFLGAVEDLTVAP